MVGMGAGSSTIASEELPSIVGGPFDVSIRYLHTMVYAYKGP